MTFDEQRWNEALIDRGQHAEEKYTRGEQVNDEDMLVWRCSPICSKFRSD